MTEKSLESNARSVIRAAVEARGWSLAQCVAELASVGYRTTHTTVRRFLVDDTRRLSLDEFAAWCLALSTPPLDCLAPMKGRARARLNARAVRDWFTGREPLRQVPDPSQYRAAAILDRPDDVPEFAAELHRQADRYTEGNGAMRAQIEREVLVYLAQKQTDDYAAGATKARTRYPRQEG